uniref:Damage-control phosphatase ARMT1-like metal-binding domain-containing protein n=1 Tax=Pyramimonas obovata TaxID=1411642 RepID=A0A7S0R303_9CHLO|mmetsp:Transcript_24469/g.53387  ORF Transcript_24469/g.53387 Transcript_24469/m.53387 type:complete len:406 (+) Transcript_24469:3-1220(+)
MTRPNATINPTKIGDKNDMIKDRDGRYVFPLLRDPADYEPCTFPLRKNADDPKHFPTLREWLQVFKKSIPSFRNTASGDSSVRDAKGKAAEFEAEYLKILIAIEKKPNGGPGLEGPGPVDVIKLCGMRDDLLRRLGFMDCFKTIKTQENARSLALLNRTLRQLDEMEESRRLFALLQGIFAGNIFDLGAAASADLYDNSGTDFEGTKDRLQPRPWLIDDATAFAYKWNNHTYKKAIMFVDNAGADVVLGMLPFAREMVRRGTQVVMAANEVPSINDITAQELEQVLELCTDQVLRTAYQEGSLVVVSSGNSLPIIDLRRVSRELADEALDADLVVMEGMGRAIETNLYAQFKCDSLKVGMVKHHEVARCLNGKLYDVVCKFEEIPQDKGEEESFCSMKEPVCAIQ